MFTLSPSVVIAAVVWFVLGLVSAITIYRRRLVAGPSPERAFVLAGTLLLAVAPVMWLIARAVTGGTSFFGGGIHLLAAALFFAAAYRIRQQRASGGASILNFTEKSAWLILGTLIVVYGSFIVRTWNAGPDAAASAFLQSLGVFIAVMIVGHAIIALFHSPIGEVDSAPDERDQRISLLSSRNAYYLMFTGFWALPVMVLAQLPVSQLLIGWFTILMLSELLYYGSVVFLYRLGRV